MKIVKSLEKKLWMINKLAGIYTIKNLKIKRFEQKNLALKLTSTWLLSLWVGVSISPIFETIWLKSLFADPKVHLSCLMVFKTCTSLYVNTNFEVLKFMNYSMNDLKFGFVEMKQRDQQMTIGDRSSLVSKKFMDFWRRYGQILAKKIEGQKCMKNANNVAR